MGNMWTSTYVPFEVDCEDYTFFKTKLEKFDHGLVSIFTESVKTPKLNASCDDPDTIASSVSSWFLCLVSTIYDICKPKLAPSIKSHQ